MDFVKTLMITMELPLNEIFKALVEEANLSSHGREQWRQAKNI